MSVEWLSSGYTPFTPSYSGTENSDGGTGLSIGTVFSTIMAGFITQIRFWKTSIDTTTSRSVGIYNASGTLVASQTTSGEPVGTAQWITVALSSPLATVAAAALVNEFVVVAEQPQQKYPATGGLFSTGQPGQSKYSTPAGALYSPSGSESVQASIAGNGLYLYGAGLNFPTNPASQAYFWVDAGWELTSGGGGGGSTGKIKVRSAGGTWDEKPVKYWTGSAWVEKPLKLWNGTAWVLA
jgi:hypothetical protein